MHPLSIFLSFSGHEQRYKDSCSFKCPHKDGVPLSACFGDVKNLKKGTPKTCLSTCIFKMGCPFLPSFFGDVRSLKKGPRKRVFQHVVSRWGALFSFLWGCSKPQKGHPKNISFNMWLRDGVPFSAFFGNLKNFNKGAPKTCLSTCGFEMGRPSQLPLGMLQAPKRAPQKHVFQHVASRWGALFSFLWGCKRLQKGRPRNMSFNMWLQDGVPFSAFFGDAPSLKKHPKNMFFNMWLRDGIPFSAFFVDVKTEKGTAKTCLSTCGFEMAPCSAFFGDV